MLGLTILLSLFGLIASKMDRNIFGDEKHSLSLMPEHKNGPLEVHMGFYIESLGSIRAAEMAYDVDLYFRASWYDKRLQHQQSDLKVLPTRVNGTDIWVPDVYFGNAKTAAFQSVLVPNSVIYIHQDGTVAYSARIILNVACNLDLFDYPLDKQQCPMRIQSYRHTQDLMNISWFSDEPVNYNQAIDLPEFEILGITSQYCNGTFVYAKTERKGHKVGEFSCLEAVVRLQRNIGYHLVQTYIPTALIVVISWIGFWIDCSAVPARISLSFTTLLTLATQGTGLRYALPPVSYAKAIDFWYGTCMLFVFAALIEFAVVNSFMRISKKLENLAEAANIMGAVTAPATTNADQGLLGNGIKGVFRRKSSIPLGGLRQRSKRMAEKAVRIDGFCRCIFPTFFFLFNVFYWFYYGYSSK